MIELTDVLFYRGGSSGYSRMVGNENGTEGGRRVARYTIQPPAEGASGIRLTFRTIGLQAGSHIQLRYYIGTDPDSHGGAGPEHAYSGILTSDGTTFLGECALMLLPGRTYYLWVFPGEDRIGYYGWASTDGPSTLEPRGAACVLPVARNGAWENRMACIKREGRLWLCASHVKKNGKLWICGPG